MVTMQQDQLPRLRGDVQLSERSWHGTRAVHLVRDPRASRTFEVGPREYFVMSRLDGTAAPADIAADYADRFGRRLDDRALRQLLGLLGTRRLLLMPDGTAPAGVEATPDESAERPTNSLLRAELRIGGSPAETTARIAAPFQPLRARAGAVAGIVLAIAAVVMFASAAPGMIERVGDAIRTPAAVIVSIIAVWSITAVHELGHGVVATLRGGRVTAYGIRWKLPVLIPFCRVEDYAFLAGRGGRVAAALVGPWVHLVAGGVLSVAWVGGVQHGWSGDVVVLTSLANGALSLVNLVPLAPLDGYAALSHATGVLQLTSSAQGYLVSRIRSKTRGHDDDASRELAGCPRRLGLIYLGYAVCAPLIVLALGVVIVWAAAAWLPDSAGGWRYAGPAAFVVIAVAGLAAAQRNRTELS